jgi:glycosyltransferase involved in cell wall biosynthesis
VILFASRLVWEKNLETLFRIYNRLQLLQLKLNFLVVGDGVARKASKQAMPDAIFTGKVDHEMLSMLYASADLFLFPSVSETYGNVVQEAMASGLPCIIADGGGSRDFIEQGVNGFKCRPFNEDDYAGKIKLLLENPKLRQQLSHAALRVNQNLTWDILANQYFDEVCTLALRPVLSTGLSS